MNEDSRAPKSRNVFGASNIVNAAVEDDPKSPIARMPLQVRKATTYVFVMKRSMVSGYAGVDTARYYGDNSLMPTCDSKNMLDEVLFALKG